MFYNKSGKRANVPEGEPPHGYVCYRCGKKGHWIQACPTNDDPNYEGHFRIKRTLGIPKTFLTKIEKPDFLDGNTDISKMQGVMVNSDGDFVIAHSDEKTWKQFQEKEKASKAAEKAAAVVDNKELQDRGIECPIDKKLFVDPMKTPCCGKTYCENCITNALIENDLTCPGCNTDNVLIDNLVEDGEARTKIKAWEEDKTRQKEGKETSRSPATSNAPTPAPNGVSSPKSAQGSRPSSSDGGKSKKRTADEVTAGDTAVAPDMKRQRSSDIPTTSTVERSSSLSTPTTSNSQAAPNGSTSLSNPPDFNAMVAAGMFPPNMNMNTDMGNMNGFPPMPFMPMPGTMPNMPNMPNMSMPMGVMNPMMMGGQNFNPMANNNWTGMPNFPNMQQPNGMGANGQNGMYSNNFGGNSMMNQPKQNQFPRNNMQNNQQNNRFPHGKQPPTGPAALQNKFSNQQRYMGKDEDQAYFRQPVNPQRAFNRVKRARPSDFKEL